MPVSISRRRTAQAPCLSPALAPCLSPACLSPAWTAGLGELNAILENNLVPSHNGRGQLRTFGCIQWECELYSGRPKARCYPFNMKGHRFWGKNCQVLHMI